MEAIQEINELIGKNCLDEAIKIIDKLPDEAVREYLYGRVAWRRGNMPEALTHYNSSAALDPKGPGAVALEQAREVMNFYHTDLYNP